MNKLEVSSPTRRTVLQRGTLAVTAVLGLSLFANAALAQGGPGPSAELVAAAKAEGTLTYYHTTAIDPTATWTG